jgi:hypothetical protein
MTKVTQVDPKRRDLDSRLNKAREKLLDALYDSRKSTLTQTQADVIRAGIEKSLRTLRRGSETIRRLPQRGRQAFFDAECKY